MPPCRIDDMSVDESADREGRIHQHHGRFNSGIEMIVDMGRVVPGNWSARDKQAEQIGARRGKLRFFAEGAETRSLQGVGIGINLSKRLCMGIASEGGALRPLPFKGRVREGMG